MWPNSQRSQAGEQDSMEGEENSSLNSIQPVFAL